MTLRVAATHDWHDTKDGDWEAFMTHYRMLLFTEGIKEGRIMKHGFSPEDVDAVHEKGGAFLSPSSCGLDNVS